MTCSLYYLSEDLRKHWVEVLRHFNQLAISLNNLTLIYPHTNLLNDFRTDLLNYVTTNPSIKYLIQRIIQRIDHILSRLTSSFVDQTLPPSLNLPPGPVSDEEIISRLTLALTELENLWIVELPTRSSQTSNIRYLDLIQLFVDLFSRLLDMNLTCYQMKLLKKTVHQMDEIVRNDKFSTLSQSPTLEEVVSYRKILVEMELLHMIFIERLIKPVKENPS